MGGMGWANYTILKEKANLIGLHAAEMTYGQVYLAKGHIGPWIMNVRWRSY